MTHARRFVSSALLAVGVTFVFAGTSAAFGFTIAGMLASVTAIAALLYAGGTWFGRAPQQPDGVLVFDRALRVVASGGTPGTHVSAHFPVPLRREIEAHCTAALNGISSHFTIEPQHGGPLDCHAAPVRAADGTILYGVLLAAAPAAPPALSF